MTIGFLRNFAASSLPVTIISRDAQAAPETPLTVGHPVPRALVNRLRHATAHEADRLIAESVTHAATIDLLMRRMLTPRMCVTGCIERRDRPGVVIRAAAQNRICSPAWRPHASCLTCRRAARRGRTPASASMTGARQAGRFRTFAARVQDGVQALLAEAQADRLALAPHPRHPRSPG